MGSGTTSLGRSLDDSTRRLASAALVVTVVLVGIGHLYVIRDLSGMTLGVPTWLWAQLVVLGCMLVAAWLAVELVASDRTGGGDPR